MDGEARAQRRRALEEKRKKLEEMKAMRAQRAQEDEERRRRERAKQEQEENNLVEEIINQAPAAPEAAVASPPPAASTASTSSPAQAPSSSAASDPSSSIAPRRVPRLEVQTGLAVVHIMPAETVTYDKGVNTDPVEEEEGDEEEKKDDKSPPGQPAAVAADPGTAPATGAAAAAGGASAPERGLEAEAVAEEQPPGAKVLSPEEQESIVVSEEFLGFMRMKSKFVERCLGEQQVYDHMVDYTKAAMDDGANEVGQAVWVSGELYAGEICGRRAVTDMEWCSQRPELLVASYGASASSFGQTSSAESAGDGLVLVWSLAMENRPEYRLSCQSPVLVSRFHESDPNLVLGGTYSGQVVLWDTRRPSSLPVRRTALDSKCHTHPVYSMTFRRTGTSSTLVTASTDGRICEWNVAELLRPLDSFQLRYDSSKDPRAAGGTGGAAKSMVVPVSVTAMDLLQADSNRSSELAEDMILVGDESGGLFSTPLGRSFEGQERRGVLDTKIHGHFGHVTSVALNNSTHPVLGNLLLTSSVDWTTKLWCRPTRSPVFQDARTGQGGEHGSLFNFVRDFRGSYEYICDAKWSTVRPGVFATINSSGELSIWDLLHSLDDPRLSPTHTSKLLRGAQGASAVAGGEAAGAEADVAAPNTATSEAPQPACRLAWSSDGRRLAVGDVQGKVHVVALSEEFTTPHSKADDEALLRSLDLAGSVVEGSLQ